MSTTPRTDAEFDRLRFVVEPNEFGCMSQRDVALFGTRDFARQLELENIKLLEVARAADWQLSLGKPHTGTPPAYPDGCECEACECWNKLERTLKSLEESGVKI